MTVYNQAGLSYNWKPNLTAQHLRASVFDNTHIINMFQVILWYSE